MRNYFEQRPWGTFENLLDCEMCKVKKIVVKPQQQPSYQYHHKRSEVWVIVEGVGVVTLDEKTIEITKGDIVNIDVLQKHRIKNVSEHDDLVFIEVQLGTYFGEDDIVRLSDDYKRN
jgi:mannose-6-phosphate isomerase-like protein (cupin superfamily)